MVVEADDDDEVSPEVDRDEEEAKEETGIGGRAVRVAVANDVFPNSVGFDISPR